MSHHSENNEHYDEDAISTIQERVKRMVEHPESLTEYTFDELKVFIRQCFDNKA